jgi:AraC family transcriptional regulator
MRQDQTEQPLSSASEQSLAFGEGMRASFGMPNAAMLVVRDLRFGPLGVTELRYDAFHYGQSAPIPRQNAVMLSLQLRRSAGHQIWEDGRRMPDLTLLEGTASLHDLRRSVTARSAEPFHSLNFNFPLGAIDEAGEGAMSEIRLAPDARHLVDPVIHALGLSLVPALAAPQRAPRLFVDHVLFAMRSHVAQRFGQERRAPRAGGLAPWQERRAKELIESRLNGQLSLAEVARACELSVAQFARAFKRSTDLPPYRFLLERRLERARHLLLRSDLPLADVAMSCGFADQSHFTKAFQKRVGASPGAFRAAAKSRRGEAD